jgi:hypothetical protein
VADKLRILGLRRSATAGGLAELFARPERSAEDSLRARGFSTR